MYLSFKLYSSINQGKRFTTIDGSIKILRYRGHENGTDYLGEWTADLLFLKLTNIPDLMKLSIISYKRGGIVLFRQASNIIYLVGNVYSFAHDSLKYFIFKN